MADSPTGRPSPDKADAPPQTRAKADEKPATKPVAKVGGKPRGRPRKNPA